MATSSDDSITRLVKGSNTVLRYGAPDPVSGYYQGLDRDRNSLRWLPAEGGPDGWVETQPDGFRLIYVLSESGSGSGSGSVPPNPVFPLLCYGCTNLLLPSVLCANHVGSSGHNNGFFLKRWNGGVGSPVPWLPSWATENSGGTGITVIGWFSDLIEDFTCDYDIENTYTSGGHTYYNHWQFTDTYYYYYGYGFAGSCIVIFSQFFIRTGTLTTTTDGGTPVVYSMNYSPTSAEFSMLSECAGSVICSPFTARHYLSDSTSRPLCACPTFTPVAGSLNVSYPCREVKANCFPVSGQYVEVFICGDGVDVPSWFPPDAT